MKIKKIQLEETPEGRWTIQDNKTGEYFFNEKGEYRLYKRPAYAISFLRKLAKEHNLNYDVHHKGKVEEIREFLDPKRYGPHDNEKQNLVTISDRNGGRLYDLMKCNLCGRTYKRYSLHNSTDLCSKNPLPEKGLETKEDYGSVVGYLVINQRVPVAPDLGITEGRPFPYYTQGASTWVEGDTGGMVRLHRNEYEPLSKDEYDEWLEMYEEESEG